VKLHYLATGNADGPLVALLHGFLGSHRDWDSLIEILGDRYYCVAIDLPGHGKSLGGRDGDYTVPSAATAIIDLIDTFDVSSFSIIGYSMGGRLALYLTSIYAMRIDALVIESASPGLQTIDERADRRARDEHWAAMLESGELEAFLESWYAQPLFASLMARPALIERIRRERMLNNPRELARALRGLSVSRQSPLWDEWRGNHIPTLVVAGELDDKYHALANEMHAACPSSTVAIIPGAGHNVHEEAPGAYNSAIAAFLNQVLNPKP